MAAAALLTAVPAFAQSADQEVVSAADAPDPVVPGGTLTYTVTLRNNGPDPATNGGLNILFDGNLLHGSLVKTIPPGFSCTPNSQIMTCNTPSFAAGSTVVFTFALPVTTSLNAFPDGTLSSQFFPSGTTADPNNANNSKTATTAYDSPQVDLAVAVVDSPDPVMPDQDLTYTVQITNAGPDAAGSVNFNVVNNTMRFQSAAVDAPFQCTLPQPGGTPIFTCSTPSLAPGVYTATVVLNAALAALGPNDGTLQTSFGINGTQSNETDQSDNNETESTAYVTPDADLSVTVADAPDPTVVEDTFSYLATVANAGPDAATPTRFNVFNGGSLQFVSIDKPAAFSCTTPNVGAAPVLTCTASSLAAGATADFVVTVRSDEDQLGPNGATVQTAFNANSNLADPNNANNDETESTTIRAFRLFSDGFEQ